MVCDEVLWNTTSQAALRGMHGTSELQSQFARSFITFHLYFSEMFSTLRQGKSVVRCVRQFSGESEVLVKTSLYDLHLQQGGKMVPFAGYSLPVQFEGLGVLKEHNHTRAENCASVFDVSHMGQIKWHGKDAVKFIEKMVVGDIASLKEGEGKLSLIMNDKGGIVDDTVITNAGDHIYMVVNGACKVTLLDILQQHSANSIMHAMFAVQGHGPLQEVHGPGEAGLPHGVPGRAAAPRTAGTMGVHSQSRLDATEMI